MKWIAYFGLALCVSIFTLASCAAPKTAPGQPPTPTVTPTPEPPPEFLISYSDAKQEIVYKVTSVPDLYSEAEKRSGCRPILPFNGQAAFDRAPKDDWVLWTFTVNFDLISENGNPLGCLRLYRRNVEQKTFDSIEQGNILVDTCKVESGGRGVHFAPYPDPSNTAPSNAAIFDGTGYIECGMNLSDWIDKISIHIPLTLTQPSGEGVSVSETFTSTHAYNNFTIAASIKPSVETKAEALLPLVYYSPTEQLTAQPALVLRAIDTDPPQFSVATVGDCNLEGEAAIRAVWWYGDQLWWYDLRQTTEGSRPYLQYGLKFLRGPIEYDKYDRSCRINNQKSLRFSLEEATLYIGYNPVGGEIFTGMIHGILIDPTDSKPEKS